jgi:hypothetical protein
MFGYPFSGDLRVSPDGFRVAEVIIEHQTEPVKRPTAP